jgi:hypothetical protein
MFARRSVPMDPEDQKLVEVARDLCRQMGNYTLNPSAISWRGKMGIRALPPEHFFILNGEIMLSSKSMGRLSPDEWRPIFASGLTYYKSLQRDMLVGMLKTMIPIVLLMPFVLVFSFKYLEGSFLIYPIILAMMVAVILAVIRLVMVPRNLWFKADAGASRLVGKDSLLESLRRIDQIDPNRTGKRRRRPAIPSPSDRIERLTRDIPLG